MFFRRSERGSLSAPPLPWLLLTAAITAGCGAQPTRGPVQVESTPPPPAAAATPPAAPETAMPNRADSVRFAVLGDWGDGSRGQLEMAAEIARVRERFPFEFVITVGDNLYGSQRPQDFVRKFETPYKPLLDAGVRFYASLGNHDQKTEQTRYKLFNMDGRQYYSMKPERQNVKMLALDSTYLGPEQMAWVERELSESKEDWKVAYFHHPPYSSGGRHGSQDPIRKALEPLFIKYNVSVVFTGHDHVYERITPQQGIVYFVTGSGGKLRGGNLQINSSLTARGFDRDQAFLIAEINGDEMYFNAVSRTGTVVDSGVITRRK
jgi:predicted MPP superfamily phosphohydrolase